MALEFRTETCSVPIPGHDYTAELVEWKTSLEHSGRIPLDTIRSDCWVTLRYIDGEVERVRISYHMPEIYQKKLLEPGEFLLVQTGAWAHVVRELRREGLLAVRAAKFLHPRIKGKYIQAATLIDRATVAVQPSELIKFLRENMEHLPPHQQQRAHSLCLRLRFGKEQ